MVGEKWIIGAISYRHRGEARGHFQHRYVGFIDCNCLRTDRPGGGPLGDGPGSLRWSNDV